MADQIISQEYLRSIFNYKDGALYWKNNKKAGSIRNDKRVHITINYKAYKSHRLIFLMHYGYLPEMIDHIDGNPLNNRIENLRSATRAENLQNAKISIKNTSGVKNVCWDKRHKQWKVTIGINNKNKYFGHYFDIECAKFVAKIMRHKYHGNFANNGYKR
jgi:hypothetical protein